MDNEWFMSSVIRFPLPYIYFYIKVPNNYSQWLLHLFYQHKIEIMQFEPIVVAGVRK